MDYELLMEQKDPSSCDLVWSDRLTNNAVYAAAIFYTAVSLSSTLVDLSAYYDLIGLLTVAVIVSAYIPLIGRNVRSLVHSLIILMWTLEHFILTVWYWQLDDRRFPAGHWGWYRLLLFYAQGLQISLSLLVSLVMIHGGRHKKARRSAIPLFGWLVSLVGMGLSGVYGRQLKQMENGERPWHYAGEMLLWFGLCVSALSAGPQMRFFRWTVICPLVYLVPCVFFQYTIMM